MGRILITSDLHFGHKNIIEYCNRPFANVEDMNKQLIERWNKTVDWDDTTYVLGDFTFLPQDKTTEICSKLNGKIRLVKGNHDKRSNQWYRDCGISEVYDYPIIIYDFFVLSHEPQSFIVNDRGPYANLFGHVHDSPMFETYGKRHFCACVERHDYTPVEFNYIVHKIGDKGNE